MSQGGVCNARNSWRERSTNGNRSSFAWAELPPALPALLLSGLPAREGRENGADRSSCSTGSLAAPEKPSPCSGSASPQPALRAVLSLFLPRLLSWSPHCLFFSACKFLGIGNEPHSRFPAPTPRCEGVWAVLKPSVAGAQAPSPEHAESQNPSRQQG